MEKSSQYSVVVDNVVKTYAVPLFKSARLKGLQPRSREEVRAVRGVTFAARQGEAFGLLGKNGSGKSTLLRMIAGTEVPTSGGVLLSGQPTLLGVSAALQPKLSGLQNIRLGLLALGISVSDLDWYVKAVKEFTQFDDSVILRPMRTYSSGMQARLTFAIATSMEPEILMIDEALGTGDATFAESAKRRMQELLSNSGTVLMVSHSAATLRKNCKRAVWLHEGLVVAEGDLSDISSEYAKWGEAITQGDMERAANIVSSNLRDYCPPDIVYESDIPPVV